MNEQRSCTNGKYFGAALLCLLLIQNTSAVLLARYTRTKYNYSVNHMLLVAEVMKLVASIFLEALTFQKIPQIEKNLEEISTGRTETGTETETTWGRVCRWRDKFNFIQSFRVHLLENPKDALKLTVPAGLYLMQNSLVYYSISLVPVPLFQITQQTKLVTTAILSVVFLKRSYNCVQWCSVLSLCIGAAICILSMSSTDDSASADSDGDGDNHDTNASPALTLSASSSLFGLLLIVLSNLSSSISGVYFEVLIKGNGTNKNGRNEQNDAKIKNAPPSIWMRNMQLAFFTICIITLKLFISHNGDEDKTTFFYDFTPLLWVQVRL